MRNWKICCGKELMEGDPGDMINGSRGEIGDRQFKYKIFFDRQVTFLYRIFPILIKKIDKVTGLHNV
jgi:hypothetical protein